MMSHSMTCEMQIVQLENLKVRRIVNPDNGGGQFKARKKSSTVVYHPDFEKVIWQVGQALKNVNKFT